MNILEAQHYIGCKVMSHDPGVKMIPRAHVAHGPYKFVKITKNGLAQLDGYSHAVAIKYLEKCPKPDREGIWEWFDELGRLRYVDVVNVAPSSQSVKHLRVAWCGGYYDVYDSVEEIPAVDGKTMLKYETKAEWPDRWGSYIGNRNEIDKNLIYELPIRD